MGVRLKICVAAFLWIFFAAAASASAAPCPPHIDPVYCQLAEDTGGHISTSEDDLAATILTQMDDAKKTRELQNRVIEVATALSQKPALLILAFAPLMPLLTMLGLSRKHRQTKLDHLFFALGTGSAPLLTLAALGATMDDGFSFNITALTIGAIMSASLCLPALIFSLIARHHKPTLWVGSVLISCFTAYGIYVILYGRLS